MRAGNLWQALHFHISFTDLDHFQGHWRALKENALCYNSFLHAGCLSISSSCLSSEWSHWHWVFQSFVLLGDKRICPKTEMLTQKFAFVATQVFPYFNLWETISHEQKKKKKKKKGGGGYGYYNDILLMNLLNYLHMCVCSIQFARGVLRHTIQTELRVLWNVGCRWNCHFIV